MTTTRVETLPATWDDARDLPFFRITDRLFTPDFCLGASVLLASYDDDILDTVNAPAAIARCSRPRAASLDTDTDTDTDTRPEHGLTPVRVRRPR